MTPEDTIQRAVFQHFRARKAPCTFAFHVPNGGKRRRVEASIIKGLGVTAGVPDIIAIHAGHTFALERKADGGKPSAQPSQTVAVTAQAGAQGTRHTELGD